MNHLTLVQQIAVLALPLIFAITLHEVAHGFVASLFGDKTAKLLGRLTLNPAKHIDPLGTILVPLLILVLSNLFHTQAFIFGWAKPVPVDPRNLGNPRRDMAFVALAGPVANLVMAFMWAAITKLAIVLTYSGNTTIGIPLTEMGQAGIMINIVLGVLNLIPLPPLDGSKVLMSLLPKRAAYSYSQIEPYGIFILLGLMATNILFLIMLPFIAFFYSLIIGVMGL